MTGTEKDLENLASAVRNSKQPTTMTFNKIEKEFDDNIRGVDNEDIGIIRTKVEYKSGYLDAKNDIRIKAPSFLKQSFIEYLQSEVERCKGDIRTDILERFWSNEKTQGYNLALERRITHLQAQIKELEV